MVRISFYPTDITHTVKNGKVIVQVYGRTTEGRQICVLDEDFEPYFYVVGGEKEALELLKQDDCQVVRVEKVKKNLNEHQIEAYKVFVNTPKAIPALKDLAKELGATVY